MANSTHTYLILALILQPPPPSIAYVNCGGFFLLRGEDYGSLEEPWTQSEKGRQGDASHRVQGCGVEGLRAQRLWDLRIYLFNGLEGSAVRIWEFKRPRFTLGFTGSEFRV